uniref:Ovule protein n=1 Tax=Brugia timori TaxID=42155 RepID=A0A0R3QEP9_9BILA
LRLLLLYRSHCISCIGLSTNCPHITMHPNSCLIYIIINYTSFSFTWYMTS